MLKVKVRWQGFTGSPGWSNFFFDSPDTDIELNADAVDAVARVNTFLQGIKAYFPPVVQWAIQSDVEQVHATSGEMFGVETVTAPAVISGTSTNAQYSAASGAVITWRTNGVRNGRRVRGRTFLVPISAGMYDTDGSLSAATVGAFVTNAQTMAGIGGQLPLGVWSRPSAPGVEDGVWYPVAGVQVPDKVAILTSRRD